MGQEVKTQIRFDGRILDGTAILEGEELIFRGPNVSLQIKFTEIFKIEASSGWLDLKTARGLILIELGPKAEAWAEKIKNPKALVEKLGVDGSKKVVCVGKPDPDLKSDLDASGAKVAKTARGKDFDVLFFTASKSADLAKLEAAKAMIKDDGGIWIVYPKGVEVIKEREVLTAGRTLGMTDNKVCKISETLTAVRFVIPVAARKKK